MKRIIILNFICIFLCLTGCYVRQTPYLKINISKDPSTLDPRKARDLNCLIIARMLYDGLTRIDQTETVQLSSAESVDISEDGRTYTFTLRSSKWTNGKTITAYDFANSWLEVLDPNFPASQAFQLYVIKNAQAMKSGKVTADQVGIKALDATHLQVELHSPVAYFLDLLATPVFFPFPKELSTQEVATETWVGNGPFILQKWEHNNLFSVRKNKTYWDANSVKLEGIDLVMVSEDTELNMFEKGELDWAGSPLSVLPVNSLKDLDKKGQLQVKPFLGTYFFRTNVEAPLLKNIKIRKALALAIQREELIEHVTQGKQLAATAYLPPSLSENYHPYFQDGDLVKAQQFFQEGLEELGIAKHEVPSLYLLYAQSERNHLIAQAVQEQWRKTLGINIHIEAAETKVFFDRIASKSYQLAAGSWIADFKDGINFLEVFKFKNSGPNNTSWENADYQHLLDESVKVIDVKKRSQIFQECETILMDQMPIIPLFHYTLLYLTRNDLKDVILSDLGSLDFKWAYIEKGKR